MLSIRELVDLQDTGNILLDQRHHITWCENIIMGRMRDANPGGACVHLSAWGTQFHDRLEQMVRPLLAAGYCVTLWATPEAGEYAAPDFNLVIVQPDHPLTREHFLISAGTETGEALIWWPQDANADLHGVLVTNSAQTQRLIALLDLPIGNGI